MMMLILGLVVLLVIGGVVAALIVGGVIVVQQDKKTLPPDVRDRSAQDVLDERFARGEIDEATYDRMSARLRE